MIRFTVFGEPQPAGSKRAFVRPGMKFPVVVDANPRVKVWKEQVAREAARVMNGAPLLDRALRLTVIFYRPRPRGHFGKHGVRPGAPRFPTTKPDSTKLIRGVEDALTGIVWRDDAQICDQRVGKLYGETARVDILVQEMETARKAQEERQG